MSEQSKSDAPEAPKVRVKNLKTGEISLVDAKTVNAARESVVLVDGPIDRPLATFRVKTKDGKVALADERTFDPEHHTRVKDDESEAEPYDVEQYDGLTVLQLRALAGTRELDQGGSREALVARLQAADATLSEAFDGKPLAKAEAKPAAKGK